jgi:hypothetical protein
MKRNQLYTLLSDCLSLDFHAEKLGHIKEQLESGTLDWIKFVSLASNHFVLQTIFRIFGEHQLLDKTPAEVVTEMQRIHSLIEARNNEMLSLSLEINDILKQIHIYPIFTKGMGHIMQDLYKDKTDRLLADVDVLIPFDSIEPAVKALKENGFTHLKELDPNKIKNLKHFPRIFKPGSLVSFEVHWEPIGPKFRQLLNEEMVQKEKIRTVNFHDCHTMSWKHALQHNFIHSQLEHRAHYFAKVFLRNMYDLALLAQKADVNKAMQELSAYQKQAASYIILTEQTFGLENFSTSDIQEKASRFFLFHHKFNLHYRLPNITLRLFVRIYHSYIRKFFRAFIDKELRKQIFRNLSSRSWYKHHFQSYRKIFGSRKL